MRVLSRKLVLPVLVLSLSATSGVLYGKKDKKNYQLDEQKRAVHALNRLTFGPRPGDVQRVAAMGVDKWIDLQLHPEKIEDSAVEAKLAPLRPLRMDTKEIVENFPPGQVIKQVAEGKQGLPRDPTKRAVYEAQLERYRDRQERKQEPDTSKAIGAADNGAQGGDPTTVSKLSEEEMANRREARLYADLKAQEILDLPPDQRMKEILRMSPDEQRELARMKREERDNLLEGMSPQQKETVLALNNPQQVVVNELMQAKLLRAIYSDRQLEEVMTDFWFNHFNVFINKGADRYLVTSYERDVIRPHALGKFEDLLVATAKSPAMLFYLDNFLSVGPNSALAQGLPARPYGRRYPPMHPRPNQGKRSSGLNENYGRELQELHTLGVSGGYT